MDVLLTYDREKIDGLGSADVMKLIQKHIDEQVPHYQECLDYYLGEQAINEKERSSDGAPNAQVVANHAKDIADTASGYFLGTPLAYSLKHGDEEDYQSEDFDRFTDALREATTDDDDQENALALSIYGKCYEYIYAAEDEPMLKVKPIDPQNAFVVYDQSIEHTELFGVYYYQKKDPLDEDEEAELDTYFIVMTETELKYYRVPEGTEAEVAPYRVEQHRLGQVPLVEYKNNKYAIGDFEQQISLIDAYNTMTSDRVNDKEQFIDAILVLYGAALGDDDEAMDQLKAKKLLEMPEGASAEYLVRQLDESGMETLRDALKEDIYTFSHVPNLTDENFAGNSSGVAMEYKLLGLEMLTKTKERWYRRSLRKRIDMFLFFLGLQGGRLSDADIEVTFSRSLPKNLYELSQIVNNLADDVTLETRLSLLPFVQDPKAEAEAMEEQKRASVERQQELFKETSELSSENTAPEETEEGNEEGNE